MPQRSPIPTKPNPGYYLVRLAAKAWEVPAHVLCPSEGTFEIWIDGAHSGVFTSEDFDEMIGGFLFAVGPFIGTVSEIGAAMLAGLGVMAGGTSLGALTALATIGFVNALVWYGRLHMRLLKPALEPTEARS